MRPLPKIEPKFKPGKPRIMAENLQYQQRDKGFHTAGDGAGELHF